MIKKERRKRETGRGSAGRRLVDVWPTDKCYDLTKWAFAIVTTKNGQDHRDHRLFTGDSYLLGYTVAQSGDSFQGYMCQITAFFFLLI